jgi:choline dehydrogenase
LAANLAAKGGFRVLLIEAGEDKEPDSYLYQVPCFHPQSSEDPEMSWNFFVHHYEKDEARDEKYVKDKGIFYPRAGTLGGCTAHNAMITIVPHDSDWEAIADLTGDDSWRADKMWKYFQSVERCLYRDPPEPGGSDPTGHGFKGWLGVSRVDPMIAVGDMQIAETLVSSLRQGMRRFWYRGFLWRIWRWLVTGDDPNDKRNKAAFEGVITTIPLATVSGKRNGAREFVRCVMKNPLYRLTVRTRTLATRVILDKDKRATGVVCLEGAHLYRADPQAMDAPPPVERTYHCTREVILAGGAFNTPQLLMLSGIGPKEHLEHKDIGIECLVDLPGVGSNLQDRYEVGVVSTMKRPFAMLKDATFKPPGDGVPADPCFEEWLKGGGVYTSNGAMAAVILRSKRGIPDPDLFIFGLPGNFHGYYPGYSKDIEQAKNYLTWAILKAHTHNRSGTIRLKKNDPRETPDVQFHYFLESEKDDPSQADLEAVVQAVKFVRSMNSRNDDICSEVLPGEEKQGDALKEWIRNNAWGHHASCSCPMGKRVEDGAVVDSRFRVMGTKGLRIVDASVFPRIPGLFIVTPIYMISEKAADVIIEDAANN